MPDTEPAVQNEPLATPGRAASASAPAAPSPDQFDVGEETPVESPSVAVNKAGKLYDPATGRLLPQAAPAPSGDSLTDSPESVAPPRPQHDNATLQAALNYGLDDDDIADMSPKELKRWVRQTEAQTRALRQENVDWAARRESVERAQEQTSQRREQRQEENTDFSIPGMNDWDEGTKQAYQPLIQEFNALRRRIKQLEAGQGNLNNYLQQQQALTLTERYDRAFAKHEQHLGKGSFGDFAPGDPMIGRRDAIISLVNQDKSKASLEVKVDKAVAILYGRRREPAPEPQGYSAEEWNDRGAARPTQRSGARELNGVKAAEQAVANRLKDLAQPTETGTVEDDDFL